MTDSIVTFLYVQRSRLTVHDLNYNKVTLKTGGQPVCRQWNVYQEAPVCRENARVSHFGEVVASGMCISCTADRRRRSSPFISRTRFEEHPRAAAHSTALRDSYQRRDLLRAA